MPLIIIIFQVIIWFGNSKGNIIDQHSQPVGWLPKVVWLTAFLLKKKMLLYDISGQLADAQPVNLNDCGEIY